MAQFFNYDPQRVSFSHQGINVTGFADGTFIEVEHSEDAFTMHVGATGDVARVQNRNRTGKITITLMATSPSNDALLAKHLDDLQNGDGAGPSMVKDASGGTKCQASTSWIMKAPKVERAKESGNVVWVIECADLKIEPRGNVR